MYWSWLLDLLTGAGWLRAAPIGTAARERVERIAVALPSSRTTLVRLALPPGPSVEEQPQLAELEQLVDPERVHHRAVSFGA